jgi:hypothetical protein
MALASQPGTFVIGASASTPCSRTMRVLNFIYYCIYRYVSKTPALGNVDAWPNLFVVFTLFVHAFFAYELFALIVSGGLWHLPPKSIFIGTLVMLMAMSYWYYNSKENGAKVVRCYEERGNSAKYARIGAILWYETFLLPFIVIGVLILSQKLTGWPPHP